jgi:O-antigen/teichoic acid export membrane protein
MYNQPENNKPPTPEDDTAGLRKKAARGMAWTLAEMFGRYGVTYVVTIYLARLLSPKDYGLVGLATAFFAIAAVIIDGGFRSALVRKKSVSPADYNTVFLTNLALSFAMYAAVYFSAPYIAGFYNEPQLTPLTRLLGITFITNAMTIVQSVDLRRNMKFNLLALITIPAEILSGAVAIFLAGRGFGAMSLAVKMLLSSITVMALYRCIVKWRPSLEFSAESFRELFKTGSKLTIATISRAVYKNVNTIFIGKVFSAQQLGYYSFSEKILNLTSNNITTAVEQVSLPTFSKIKDDNDRLARGYKQAVQGATAIIFPIIAALALMAEPLVALFLNERWMPAVPYIRILCATGSLIPLHTINNNILIIKDVNLYLKIEYAAVLTLLAMLFSLAPLGIEIFLIGQAFHTAALVIATDFCNSRRVNSRFLAFAAHVAPIALAAAAAGGAAYLVMGLFETVGFAQCALLAAVDFAVYCFFLWVFRVEIFVRAVETVKVKIKVK